jgi:hypothetical protein
MPRAGGQKSYGYYASVLLRSRAGVVAGLFLRALLHDRIGTRDRATVYHVQLYGRSVLRKMKPMILRKGCGFGTRDLSRLHENITSKHAEAHSSRRSNRSIVYVSFSLLIMKVLLFPGLADALGDESVRKLVVDAKFTELNKVQCRSLRTDVPPSTRSRTCTVECPAPSIGLIAGAFLSCTPFLASD